MIKVPLPAQAPCRFIRLKERLGRMASQCTDYLGPNELQLTDQIGLALTLLLQGGVAVFWGTLSPVIGSRSGGGGRWQPVS